MAQEVVQSAKEEEEEQQCSLVHEATVNRSACRSRLLLLPALLALLLATAALHERIGEGSPLRSARALASGQSLSAEEVQWAPGDGPLRQVPDHWAFQADFPVADSNGNGSKEKSRSSHPKAAPAKAPPIAADTAEQAAPAEAVSPARGAPVEAASAAKAAAAEAASAESSTSEMATTTEAAHVEAGPAKADPAEAAVGSDTEPAAADGCYTAVQGERCYDAVLWAYFTGIHTNPEWYEGLSLDSKFEDFQAHFHRIEIKNCSKPCDTTTELLAQKAWEDPSLLCFSVAIGYELDLIRAMVPKRAGIFDCEENTVLSNEAVDFGLGIESLLVEVVDGGMGQSGTIANVQTFINSWAIILGSRHFEHHDFTVKVDPDAVMLPSRLRAHLSASTGRNVYVPNCDHRDIWPGSPDYPMMYGAVEALSQAALKAYEDGHERCATELDWRPWGEDLYLGKCLQMLGVGQALDTDQVRDETCCPGDPGHCPERKSCTDGGAAAFHKFKSADEWLECWQQATGVVSEKGSVQLWMS